jgi:phospho-N-acetylmuramoyl-pentapeptide-transferase
MGAMVTALILSFVYGNACIRFAQRFFRSSVREYVPSTHDSKNQMPTMGGIFIIAAIFMSCLIWCDLTNIYVWLLMLCLFGFGSIGFYDDYVKIKRKKGISEGSKFIAQIVAALFLMSLWMIFGHADTHVCLPIIKTWLPDVGVWFVVWGVFLLVATSNAVNLTDGLDGLAIGSLIPTVGTFSLIAYLAGHAVFSSYLHIPFVDTSEVAIVGMAIVGASLGFLWYNAYPAQIFMGDVGSLALGATLAFMALMTKQELLLAIAGGVFVFETVSVIMQVFWYKRFKRKIFRMAPIHHHFELLGWNEPKIVVRFALITMVLCMVALMVLKIR